MSNIDLSSLDYSELMDLHSDVGLEILARYWWVIVLLIILVVTGHYIWDKYVE